MATNFIFKNTWVYKLKFAPLNPHAFYINMILLNF